MDDRHPETTAPPPDEPLGTLIAVDPTGQRALLQAGAWLRVVALGSGEVQSYHAPGAVVLRSPWLPDGEAFALRLGDETPALLRVADGSLTPLPAPGRSLDLAGAVSPPSVSAGGLRLALRRGAALELWNLAPAEPEAMALDTVQLPDAAAPVLDPTGSRVVFRDSAGGLLVMVDLALDRWAQWPEVAPTHQFDLAWSPDSERFFCAGTMVDVAADEIVPLFPPASDASGAPVSESVEWLSAQELLVLRSRTVLGSGGLVREQQLLRLNPDGRQAPLFSHSEPTDPIVPAGFSAVRRLPGQGACLLSHHSAQTLFITSLAGGKPTPLPLRWLAPREMERGVVGVRGLGEAAPRALPAETRRRVVANFGTYIHQLRDVPDWFDGDWACGPASCLMLAAHFGRLARWPTPISRGSGHLSDYGAYIPGLWQGGGTRFTVQQNDPQGRAARGAYGYICPPGTSFVAADWGRMEQFLRLMGLQVQPNLANVSGLDWDAAWARLVEQVDQGHACLLSVTLRHPSGRTIEHIFVATGYVEYADGRRALIAKDPYGNWTTAGFGGSGGDGVHYWFPRSAEGAPSSGLVRIKFIRGVWNDAPRPAGVVLDDGIPDFNRFGPPERWSFASSHGYGSPGRALSPGPASGLWWTTTDPFGPWSTWATWRLQVAQAGRYRLMAFVPSEFATTRAATYHLAQSRDGIAPPPPMDPDMLPLPAVGTLAQADFSDEWRIVGELSLAAGWAHVYLSTVTGEADKRIAFDAVRLDPL